MVQMVVTASVKVVGGPTIPLGSTIESESYTYASILLKPNGTEGHEDEVNLLPAGGTPTLLAIRAVNGTAKAASVDVTCKNGEAATNTLVVDGVLLIANADVLKRLVDDGPRTLLVKNKEPDEVTVEILTGLAPGLP